MKPTLKYHLIFTLLLFSTMLHAQSAVTEPRPDPGFAKRWSIGIGFGPDFYYGDLNLYKIGISKNVSLAGSLFFQYQISNVFGTRLQFLGAWLNGSRTMKVNGEIVDNPFTGIILESNISGVINFSNLFSRYRSSRWFFVYGVIGVGYSGWYTKLINKVYDASTITTDNPLSNFHSAVVIPAGLGVLFRLGNRVNASLEYTLHTLNSDLLDQLPGGSAFDRFDYLAIGISVNLGKTRKKVLPLNDYAYPVSPVQYPVQSVPMPIMEVKQEIIPTPMEEEYTYAVQIFAFNRHKYSPAWIRQHYHIPQAVRMEKEGQMERFLIDQFMDLRKATELRDKMLKLGIRDAFIIAYKNGVRHHTVTR